MLYDGLGYLLVLTGNMKRLQQTVALSWPLLSGVNVLNLILYKTPSEIQVCIPLAAQQPVAKSSIQPHQTAGFVIL
jgi:hypothetical protein